MWNEFINDVGAPTDLLLSFQPALPVVLTSQFLASAENDKWTLPKTDDIDYVINYNPTNQDGEVVAEKPDKDHHEHDEHEHKLIRNNYREHDCEFPECVECTEEFCEQLFTCNEKHVYIPFCQLVPEFACDHIPKCVDCPNGHDDCQTVFACEDNGRFEGYV